MKNAYQPAFPDMRGAEQSMLNQSPHELPTGLTKREYFALAMFQARMIGLSMQKLDYMRSQVVELSIADADELLKQLEYDKN